MLSLNDDFLGYHPQNHNVLFSGSDTEELFTKNLKTKPNDWYYRTNQISYVRNINGHRCKNIEEIDLDNYILFAGCSHTEGIGLKLEDTYPYLLSKKMNCDYYNLSIGGTGVDTLSYNLVTWFAKIKKPPKLLIVQWPHNVRLTLENFPDEPSIEPLAFHAHGIWSDNNHKGIGELFLLGDKYNLFNTLSTLTRKLIYNIATCPVVEVKVITDKNADVAITFNQIDYARDEHLGVESQKINTELIYKAI
jgi:hypothetical protein